MTPMHLFDASREEFGCHRVVCSCKDCQTCCKIMPGFLIPSDLTRLLARFNIPEDKALRWSIGNLLASPGAKVVCHGKLYSIPTLVPARQDGGVCRFLTEEGQCSIHADAPFGCAFFSTHMSEPEGTRLSSEGLKVLWFEWLKPGSLYVRMWTYLDQLRLWAPSPWASRRQLQHALPRE